MEEKKLRLLAKKIHGSALLNDKDQHIGRLSFIEKLDSSFNDSRILVAVCSNILYLNGSSVKNKFGYKYSYVISFRVNNKSSINVCVSELRRRLSTMTIKLVLPLELTLFDLINNSYE